MRRWAVLAVFFALALITAEWAARHFAAVPLYRRDAIYGYELRAGQSGIFLGKRWRVNRQGMPNSTDFVDGTNDVLLLGDSFVYGGNPYDHDERLGPLLSEVTGQAVWSMAAGGWSLDNAVAYLAGRPALAARMERIVVVVNDGDFGQPGKWQGEWVHPTERPDFYLWYLLRRYVPAARYAAPDTGGRVAEESMTLPTRAQIVAFAHPRADRTGCDFVPPELSARHPVYCYRGAMKRGPSALRDGFHPTVAVNRDLARFIAARLDETAPR